MGILTALATLSPLAFGQPRTDHVKSLAPFVASPQLIVERMLEAAGLRSGEVVYDLGCGDGRVLIAAVQKFQASRAVGIELSPRVVRQAQESIRSLGLENRITVLQGDLLAADVREADVVVLYLMTDANDRVRPVLERSLKPGARVVSHEFQVRGWKPSRVEETRSFRKMHTIYVYQMPPRY